MLVFVNGELIPEERAAVSVFDRSFLYGDGLFETIRVFNGQPFRWREHVERLERGAAFLRIKMPSDPLALRQQVAALVERNQLPDSLLRITLSRGVGVRGYSPAGADRPTLVMSLHAAPQESAARAWDLVTSSFRLPSGEALARFKTCNKLTQIMARAEAEAAGADEALLLNTDGFVVEGASSNLFWVEAGGAISTPALESGVLAGVTRMVVAEICASFGLAVRECNVSLDELKRCSGVFLSLSSLGVVGARTLNGFALAEAPLVKRIQAAYTERVRNECEYPSRSHISPSIC